MLALTWRSPPPPAEYSRVGCHWCAVLRSLLEHPSFRGPPHLHQMACGVYFCWGGCRLCEAPDKHTLGVGGGGLLRMLSRLCQDPMWVPTQLEAAFKEKVHHVVQLASYSHTSGMKHTSGYDLICPVTVFFVTSIMFNFQHFEHTRTPSNLDFGSVQMSFFVH